MSHHDKNGTDGQGNPYDVAGGGHHRDQRESKGINGSHSTSMRENQRALLDRDELERLPTNTCIYLLRGVRPFISKKSH